MFLISETKIDDSFRNLKLKVVKVLGKILLLLFYVNEKLNCRSLESFLPNTFIEILELRLLNSKWLTLGTYKPPS